ncbi:VirB3 family type IV secretion system protein [Yersinia ruckeri]|nr:VirB3 family type IV secretion system protein [Yersinia ruckeri]
MSNPLDEEYISYNGLNRPAMGPGGIPLMILLPMMALAIFSTFAGVYFFGLKGITPALIILVILMFVRIAVESDPTALDVIKLKAKGYWLQRDKILLIKESHEN